ncbi:MAG: hypothetical protein ATN34_03505 [Epulopiscium sp. Nele67-Bin002]|nr:MAG: hypothetical protein BEN18_05765 [Epulopiscium sp. Nuni2H_MBin001]OON92217.1 MAG: hypothetical protein ATN34_03505 [Epulopiscium sp. Nele67-Bin002]OON93928.1 MAG: hypothetical protein ATN33_05060 [Epulopiscium sp. Nele67-Bin001]
MYDAIDAISYALMYYKEYNNIYPNYGDLDSTNFVSQCLFAGGLPMQHNANKDPLLNWYCLSKNQYNEDLISPTWYCADYFYKYWSSSAGEHFTFTVKDVKRPKVLDLIEPGDPITLFNHNKITNCIIVIRREGEHIICASHEENTIDMRLVEFNLRMFRIYKLNKKG